MNASPLLKCSNLDPYWERVNNLYDHPSSLLNTKQDQKSIDVIKAISISKFQIDWFDTEGDTGLDSTDIVDDTLTDCVVTDQENDDENKI